LCEGIGFVEDLKPFGLQSAVEGKNAANTTIVKIYKAITYLTSNRG
jgi:hypothetical protein